MLGLSTGDPCAGVSYAFNVVEVRLGLVGSSLGRATGCHALGFCSVLSAQAEVRLSCVLSPRG